MLSTTFFGIWLFKAYIPCQNLLGLHQELFHVCYLLNYFASSSYSKWACAFLVASRLGFKFMLFRSLWKKDEKTKILNYQIEELELWLIYLCTCVTKYFEVQKFKMFSLNIWMKLIFQEKYS